MARLFDFIFLCKTLVSRLEPTEYVLITDEFWDSLWVSLEGLFSLWLPIKSRLSAYRNFDDEPSILSLVNASITVINNNILKIEFMVSANCD